MLYGPEKAANDRQHEKKARRARREQERAHQRPRWGRKRDRQMTKKMMVLMVLVATVASAAGIPNVEKMDRQIGVLSAYTSEASAAVAVPAGKPPKPVPPGTSWSITGTVSDVIQLSGGMAIEIKAPAIAGSAVQDWYIVLCVASVPSYNQCKTTRIGTKVTASGFMVVDDEDYVTAILGVLKIGVVK